MDLVLNPEFCGSFCSSLMCSKVQPQGRRDATQKQEGNGVWSLGVATKDAVIWNGGQPDKFLQLQRRVQSSGGATVP